METVAPLDRLQPSPKEVEKQTGLRVVVRGAHLDNPYLKGRMYPQGSMLIIEFNDDNPGFFWHIDTIEQLLSMAMDGRVREEVWGG